MKQAEPKGADFLLDKNPICNPEQTTVRSGEARQSSQAGGVSFNPTFYHSLRMSILPTLEEKTIFDNFKELCIHPKFEQQKVIKTPFFTYIADFCIEKHKIIIEIDGLSHLGKLDKDIKRDLALEELGYTVIHFSNKEVRYSVHHCFKRINQIITMKHFFNRWNGMFKQRYEAIKERYKYQIEIEKNYINGRSKIKDIINQYIEKIKFSALSIEEFRKFRRKVIRKDFMKPLLLIGEI